MDLSGGDVGPLARPEDHVAELISLAVRPAEDEAQPARQDVDPLVLLDVVLERQALARLHDEELADVAVGVGPDELVAPGLLDAPRQGILRRGRNRRHAGLTRLARAARPRPAAAPG